jgi:basic membrane lipoprotein Med (substrate-binding protein (PBP1-ABC) superfamily)
MSSLPITIINNNKEKRMGIRMWKLVSTMAIFSLLLAACGGQAGVEKAATDVPPTQEAQPANSDANVAAKFKFSLVTPNPRGDRSFIDASIRGAEKAMNELPVEGSIIESQGVSRSSTSFGY